MSWHEQQTPVQTPQGASTTGVHNLENFLTEAGVPPMYRQRRRSLSYRILRALRIH